MNNGDSSDEKGKDDPDSDYDSEVENPNGQTFAQKRLNDGGNGIPMVNVDL